MYDEHQQEDVDKNWQDDHWYDALSYMLAKVKWIDAKSGSYGLSKIQSDTLPKISITDKQGNFIPLDPDKFANPSSKGVWYKE